MTTSLFKLEFVQLFGRKIRPVGQFPWLTFQHTCSYQGDLDIFWGVWRLSLQFQKSVHYLYDPFGCWFCIRSLRFLSILASLKLCRILCVCRFISSSSEFHQGDSWRVELLGRDMVSSVGNIGKKNRVRCSQIKSQFKNYITLFIFCSLNCIF